MYHPSVNAVTDPPEILALLGDPLRWQLVVELSRSDRRVGELVQLVGKPQNLVSYHLGELRRAGIVSARRSSADGRDVYYRADLFRCRDLLGDAGRVAPSRALARADATDRAEPRRPTTASAVPVHRQQRPLPDRRGPRRSTDRRADVEARSAGSHPKPLHPNAVRVMAERGIDISGRPTKSLTRFARSRFDRVITLCDKVREICPEFPGAPIAAHWSIADPAAAGATDEATYPAFQRVADEIEGRVALLLADLDPDHGKDTHA